eukprot:gnl/MRDRNA2_/MRDRNA2_94281_c0_seq1.p1 gnl/MRDRNA2_/MRDRNA2_94281_c0~~gnl/MRDRNA2_/MRDRNA2_94281_c0_seq1.p1  ORF type:complete len:1416 (+),score=292.18 gnl/MRDRNA2_/MRDRNA2_94281_c0_seq1:81-4250(+)
MAHAYLDSEDGRCRVSFIRGIVVLHGESVDEVAQKGLDRVPQDWQAKRVERDGNSFHITFLTKGDLQDVARSLRNDELESIHWSNDLPRPDPEDYGSIVHAAVQLLRRQPACLEWIDVGEGRARDDGGEAAFRVVLWQSGTAVRRALGLAPHDFHISLGFRGHDVHGKGKGLASLTQGAPSAPAAQQLTVLAAQLMKSESTGDCSMLVNDAADLADAALLSASAHGDLETEKLAHRLLCQIQGRLKRSEAVLAHADRLLEIDHNDECGCRFRAFALTMLGRYREALPAIERAQAMLDQVPESERMVTSEKLTKAADLCQKKMGTSPGTQEEHDSANDDAGFEHDFLEARKLKFPSTPHLKDLGSATRDDKHLDPTLVKKFCGGSSMVVVEEKIDGANLGISLDSQYRPRLQGRSKWVNWETDYQFKGLEEWLSQHASTLCEVLERNRDILFGEWCAYRHTVEYTSLPCYFLAFDIYDRHVGRFLSRRAFHTRLQRASGAKIACVPLVTYQVFQSVEEVEQLLKTQSKFGSCPLEGCYLRLDGDVADSTTGETYLEHRCKLVRSGFQQAIEEGGTWRGRGKNGLDMDLACTYAEQSHVFAEDKVTENNQVEHLSQGSGMGVAKSKDNYPKTPHVPFSPGVNPDDSRMADCAALLTDEVIVTEKLDGGNCCIKNGLVYARTHGQPATHESFSAVKQLVHNFPIELDDVELFGENMAAVHSIEYGNLSSYFYLFAIRQNGQWLKWDEVVAWAEKLELPTVPVVFRGKFVSPTQFQACLETWAREPSAVGSAVQPEGFVIRRVRSFSDCAFQDCIAKYVRAGHIQTDETWKRRWKKAQLGHELPKRAPRSLGSDLKMKLSNPRTRHTISVPRLGDVELPRNFSFLVDEVAVSSTPKNCEQIKAMASMGISLVVTLTEETPLPPEWFNGTGVENRFVPVPNYYPPTVAQADSILEQIAQVAASGSKTMVHCGGGKGRAGTVAACLILRYGISSVQQSALCQMQSDEVITFLREARPGSVETERQERFIREYASLLWMRAAEAPEAPPLQREVSRQRSDHEEESLVASDLFGDATACEPAEDQQVNKGRIGAKARRAEKEIERMRKDTQKRAPKYILMCGLPGAGKSTFSCALEQAGNWIRANQDDLGRKGCVQAISNGVPLVKKGTKHLVLDRCNITRAERKEWMDYLGQPPAAEIMCVFFDSSAEDCKKRAAARLDHPTIRPGGGGRIIEDQAKKLERPDKSEGFGVVEVVKSFEDAEKLLQRFGIAGTSASSSAATSSTNQGGYAPLSVPTTEREKVAAICEESVVQPEVARVYSSTLPPRFKTWLDKSLCEELAAADAEGILAAVEVILTCEDDADDEEGQLSAAVDVLQDAGAPECALAFKDQWYAAKMP